MFLLALILRRFKNIFCVGDGYFGGDFNSDVDGDVDHFYFQVGLALPLDPLPQRSRGIHPGTTQDANPGILSILRITMKIVC